MAVTGCGTAAREAKTRDKPPSLAVRIRAAAAPLKRLRRRHGDAIAGEGWDMSYGTGS